MAVLFFYQQTLILLVIGNNYLNLLLVINIIQSIIEIVYCVTFEVLNSSL